MGRVGHSCQYPSHAVGWAVAALHHLGVEHLETTVLGGFLNAGNWIKLGELRTASSGAHTGGTPAVDVAVAVWLYFQAQVFIWASTFAPVTSQGDVGATERFILPQPEILAAFLTQTWPRPRERWLQRVTLGSGELRLFLSLQAALGDAVGV